MSEKIIDPDGTPITVGTRVYCGAPGTDEAALYATVVQITDPDGDVDDEGRGVFIPARVYVLYDDGTGEHFGTWWTASGPWDEGAPHQCDDVSVASDTGEGVTP